MNGKKKPSPEPDKPEKTPEPPVSKQEVGTTDFTQQDLNVAWKEFAENLKDRPRLHNMLKNHVPELKENFNMELLLENPLQEETIKGIYNKLLHQLKQKLNNDQIEIDIKIMKEEDTSNDSNKLYTLDDRFNFLAEKNKSLQKFKKDFDLDFE